MNANDILWSEKEITTMYELWNNGASFTEIGEVLGRTKGSVAGRVSRAQKLGLLEPRNDAQIERRMNLRKPASKLKKPKKSLLDEPPEEPPLPDPRASFMAQRDGLCKYPEGNSPPYQYCLKPVTLIGSSWCEEHRKRVFSVK